MKFFNSHFQLVLWGMNMWITLLNS